jgi:hypothetical protein
MARYRFIEAGNKIICISTYAKKVVRGVAKCSPNDNFDIEIGKKLAQLRCDEKVCNKRAIRALEKYMEAEYRLFAAKEYFENMRSYYLESEKRHDDVVDELKKFSRTI